MDATLILYAVIAAGLVIWLRSVLGTKHGDERERPNPFTAPTEKPAASSNRALGPKEDVVTLPLADATPVLPRNVTLGGDSVQKDLFEISRIMRDFDLSRFTQGAQDAFVIIVEAFAAGDKETLRNLLEPQVYASFDAALRARDESGETMSSEIHSVRKMEILNAHSDAKSVYVKVRFIADETCIIKNKDGVIISGDPDRITEMNDIWTFSRAIKSREPVWYLHETRDGDVTEDHKTPVPDAG